MPAVFTLKSMLCAVLAAGLCIGGSYEVYAQGRDSGRRIERLDRIRDRLPPRNIERPHDRVIVDRPDVRDEPVTTERDLADDSEPEIDQSPHLIILEETGYRVRRGEILALDLSDAARREVLDAGLVIIRERVLGPDQILFVLRGDDFDVPTQMIQRLKAVDPNGIFTPNHIYAASGDLIDSVGSQLALKKVEYLSTSYRVGMIDGRPDITHPRLAAALTGTMSFNDVDTGASRHGTAVALRLIDVGAEYVPNMELQLYAADVLSGEGQSSASAEALIAALSWQQGNHVDVLNISLAGPPNDIVAIFVQKFLATGGQIVAAAGNGGPLSMDIYPAAYEGVVGVTATSKTGDVFELATRGAHVDLAAPGVDILISEFGDDVTWSGTSYAAPYAAIWLLAADQYGLVLSEGCSDTGKSGRDDTYGCGLISFDRFPRVHLAAVHKTLAD